MKPLTSPLDGSEWAALREYIARIQAVVTRRYGAPTFDQSYDDLVPLQRLLDEKVYQDDDEDDLRAVAAVFGNVVAKQLSFEWVADGDGRYRQHALSLKPNGALVVQPLKMVVTRVQGGGEVSLRGLVDEIKKQAQKTRLI
jgi:hypothetical protein